MKKQKKVKAAKRTKSGAGELPELVTVMAKLVERLEILEKKTDMILSRISSVSSGSSPAHQNVHRPENPPRSGMNPPGAQSAPQNHHANPSRPMYQAVCADCRKACEIPFRPTGERPVYCKDCFSQRKAERFSKSPGGHANLSRPESRSFQAPAGERGKGNVPLPETSISSKGNKSMVKKRKKR